MEMDTFLFVFVLPVYGNGHISLRISSSCLWKWTHLLSVLPLLGTNYEINVPIALSDFRDKSP